MLITSKMVAEVTSDILFGDEIKEIYRRLKENEPILAKIMNNAIEDIKCCDNLKELVPLELGLVMYLLLEKVNNQQKNRESYVSAN